MSLVPVAGMTSFWAENWSSGSRSQIISVLAKSSHLMNLLRSSQTPLCLRLWSKHTCSMHPHRYSLFLHQTQAESTPLLQRSLHRPPRGSYLVFHRGSTSSELFSSASADSYHPRRYLLAALHGSQDGCISVVFSLMSKIKLYAWQPVPKWIPLQPAGVSEVRS